jgi:hypothetical protein
MIIFKKSLGLFFLSYFLFSIFHVPVAYAVLNSTNYKIQGETFNTTGTINTSAGGYKMDQNAGEAFTQKLESANYDARSGHNYEILANVPLAPTVTNVTSYDYDRLRVKLNLTGTVDQTNGTLFAIQVSTDNFASSILYVQSDNTLSPTLGIEDYQDYATWGGGSGVTVTGLSANTTYSFRARAFNGDATESEWGPTASAATAAQTLSLIATAGTCSPTGSVTASAISFDAVAVATPITCSHTLTSTTNAYTGFITTVATNQNGLTAGSNDIDPFTGSWAVPAPWSSPSGVAPNVNSGWIGYTTNDTTIETAGGTNPFAGATKYAAFESTAREVSSSTSPATGGQSNDVSTRLEINALQPDGSYAGMTQTYQITGTF